jgi:predicted  nucleic acid-binding Zn-ribbon protein
MYNQRNEGDYQEDFNSIKFLKDGRYEINCELVSNFNLYREERREKEELERKRLQKIKEEEERVERIRIEEENRKKR